MSELLKQHYQNTLKRNAAPNWAMFSLIAGLNLIVLFLTNRYIITFPVFERSWADRLNTDQLNSYFVEKEHLAFLGYLALVLYLLVKYSIIALLLQAGSDFMGSRLRFGELFRIVMIAEMLFIFPQALKLIYFWNATNFTINDLNNFEPFSLAALFHPDAAGPWEFPLRALNLWELLYWLLLADGLRQLSGRKFLWAAKLVIYSYVPALFFWLMTVAFFTFTISR